METEKVVTVESQTDPTLQGAVTVGVPNGAELIQIGLIQHKLRHGIPLSELDDRSAALVIMLSSLTVVVRAAPDWWYRTEGGRKVPAPEQVRDANVLWALYKEYIAWLDERSRPAESALATAQPANP